VRGLWCVNWGRTGCGVASDVDPVARGGAERRGAGGPVAAQPPGRRPRPQSGHSLTRIARGRASWPRHAPSADIEPRLTVPHARRAASRPFCAARGSQPLGHNRSRATPICIWPGSAAHSSPGSAARGPGRPRSPRPARFYQYSSVWSVPMSWPLSRTKPRLSAQPMTVSIMPGLPHRKMSKFSGVSGRPVSSSIAPEAIKFWR
jgi:hypothetical protein